MNKLCVYTCITGDYDNLHEIKNPEKNIDYLCFTNNKNLKSKTWKIIYIDNSNLNNHNLSRKIKILGHPTISKNYEISVWMDASVIWEKSIHDFVSTYLKDKAFASFKHHARNSIQEEAIACLRLRKDTKESIIKALGFLEQERFPDNIGLYEMTVFIKKHNDPIVDETMHIWFDTLKKYSRRDQLSFMYAVWKTGLKISTINLNVWDNPWFTNSKHNPQDIQTTKCHVYYGNPDSNFNFDKYFIYSYHQRDDLYQFNTIIPNDTTEIEFNPTNVIGTKFEDITIHPSPQRQTILGSMFSAFCINHGVIRAYGDFHKNQKLSFSIRLLPPSTADLYKLIEKQWEQNNQLLHSSSNIEQLQQENQRLKQELQNIKNSKSWKTINKIHKTFHPSK